MPVFVFSDYHAGRINFTFENSQARRIVDTLRAESPCTRVIPTKTLKHSRKKRRKNKSLKANILNLILFKGFTLPAHPFTLPAPMNIVGPFNENCPGLGCLLVFQLTLWNIICVYGLSLDGNKVVFFSHLLYLPFLARYLWHRTRHGKHWTAPCRWATWRFGKTIRTLSGRTLNNFYISWKGHFFCLGPIWTVKNGFANFFVLAKIFYRRVRKFPGHGIFSLSKGFFIFLNYCYLGVRSSWSHRILFWKYDLYTLFILELRWLVMLIALLYKRIGCNLT